MRYQLVVKGSKQDMFDHSSQRNIPVVFVSTGDGYTIGHSNAPLEDIEKWFSEEPRNPPFPIGTLLWYQENEYNKPFGIGEIKLFRKENQNVSR